jgi:hypothetical protein
MSSTITSTVAGVRSAMRPRYWPLVYHPAERGTFTPVDCEMG